MKTAALIAALIAAATVAIAAVPPIKYVVESIYQQEQELDDQKFVQGAGVVLQYRIRTDGTYWDLSGLGARWEARESSTSTNALQSTGTIVTSTTPHYIEFQLDSTQTGSAVTNWPYRVFITDGGDDYPLGVGDLNIAASTWTGAAAVLSNVTAAAYTDAAVATHAAVAATTNSLGHVIVGAGLSVDGDGVLSNPQPVPAWGDVTDKPFTNISDIIHSDLSGLGWTESGHTGTAARVAIFSEGGIAGEGTLGAGLGWIGDVIAVSNDVITGAASGATAVQPATLAGYVATNDTRYLAALTNVAWGDIGGTLSNQTDLTNTVAQAAGALPKSAGSGNSLTGDLYAKAYTGYFSGIGLGIGTYGAFDGVVQGNRYTDNENGTSYYWIPDNGSKRVQLEVLSETASAQKITDIYFYPEDRANWGGLDFEGIRNLNITGDHTVSSNLTAATASVAGALDAETVEADSYALTDNKRAISATTEIPTNATYTVSYADGPQVTYSFGAGTGDLTIDFTPPGTNYFADVVMYWQSGYTNRAVTYTNTSGSLTWIGDEPTTDRTKILADFIENDLYLMNVGGL